MTTFVKNISLKLQKIGSLFVKGNTKSIVLFSIFLFFFWILALNVLRYYGFSFATFEGLETATAKKNEIVIDGKTYVLKDDKKKTTDNQNDDSEPDGTTKMDETDVMTDEANNNEENAVEDT
jgi:hypothetical protein